MTIPRARLDVLEGLDATGFSRWLLSGFEAILGVKQDQAFAPLHHFVGHEDDVTQELTRIHDSLSGPTRQQFKDGVAAAIANLRTHTPSVPVLHELLHLAGRIKAVEILPVVIPQIGNGFFGAVDDPASKGTFSLTLDIVSGMAPAREVPHCLRRLIGSSFFRPRHAPKAFVSLCRSEPDNYPAHIDLLRDFFAELHRECGLGHVAMTAHRFVHYVPLPDITGKLHKLTVSRNPAHVSRIDNWLLDGLFLAEDAPLELDKAGGFFTIIRRGCAHPPTHIELDEERRADRKLSDYLNHVIGRRGSGFGVTMQDLVDTIPAIEGSRPTTPQHFDCLTPIYDKAA